MYCGVIQVDTPLPEPATPSQNDEVEDMEDSSTLSREDDPLWILFNTIRHWKNSLGQSLAEPFLKLPSRRYTTQACYIYQLTRYLLPSKLVMLIYLWIYVWMVANVINYKHLFYRIYPDYYEEIKKPMSLLKIKKKLKNQSYRDMDRLEKDLNLVFENAKRYNIDESKLYKVRPSLTGGSENNAMNLYICATGYFDFLFNILTNLGQCSWDNI